MAALQLITVVVNHTTVMVVIWTALYVRHLLEGNR